MEWGEKINQTEAVANKNTVEKPLEQQTDTQKMVQSVSDTVRMGSLKAIMSTGSINNLSTVFAAKDEQGNFVLPQSIVDALKSKVGMMISEETHEELKMAPNAQIAIENGKIVVFKEGLIPKNEVDITIGYDLNGKLAIDERDKPGLRGGNADGSVREKTRM